MRLVEVQRAIYLMLTADIPLMSLIQGVFDHVDQGQDYPYVVIGEDGAAEWDTDTEQGVESLLTIHSWTRYKGRMQVKTIQEAIYECLHRKEIVIEDAIFYSIFWEFSDSFLDPDGETRHGVCRYRIRYDIVPVS